MPRVRLLLEWLRTAASHKDPPPRVPGADSWTVVAKLPLPAPTTALPPPSTTAPAGHTSVSRTQPPAGRLTSLPRTVYCVGLRAQTAKMPRVRLVAERLLTAASHKDPPLRV